MLSVVRYKLLTNNFPCLRGVRVWVCVSIKVLNFPFHCSFSIHALRLFLFCMFVCFYKLHFITHRVLFIFEIKFTEVSVLSMLAHVTTHYSFNSRLQIIAIKWARFLLTRPCNEFPLFLFFIICTP